MKWFSNPQTLEQLKKQYKKLAMQHHPDVGGSVTNMQEINAEYDKLFELLKNTHQTADGKTYTAKTETTETAAEFKDIINRIINLNNITIEIQSKCLLTFCRYIRINKQAFMLCTNAHISYLM